jgi:hypothetical protein
MFPLRGMVPSKEIKLLQIMVTRYKVKFFLCFYGGEAGPAL